MAKSGLVVLMLAIVSGAAAIQTNGQLLDQSRRMQVENDVLQSEPFVPNQAGFRAAILGRESLTWQSGNSRISSVAEDAVAYVSQQIGQKGLLRTYIDALRIFDLPWWDKGGVPNEPLLWHVGIPVDLLKLFQMPIATGGEMVDPMRCVATILAGPIREEDLDAFVKTARFAFRPSAPGFRVMAEDGSSPVGIIRMQLPLPDVVLGEGDGTAADIFRSMSQRIQDVDFVVQLRDAHVERFKKSLSRWGQLGSAQVQVVTHPYFTTQWAQDNAKMGSTTDETGRCRPVTLVPRYASQGEGMSVFIPTDSLIVDSLSGAGIRVIQSPLLFQGGNLLPLVDPCTGERILLIGEAEIWRNVALGLRREEVEEAFRMEFGVDRCVILPAVSFHIDLELSVRARDGFVALVNDSPAAARHVLSLGADSLSESGYLDQADVVAIRARLVQHDDRQVVSSILRVLSRLRTETGTLPESLSRSFGVSSSEDARANLQRFLLSLDLLTALALTDDELATVPMGSQRVEYYRLLRHREDDRTQFREQLRNLGFQVRPIPSLSDEEVSINYINGVQDRDEYLMPVMGGYFRSLDDVARSHISAALGERITVVPVPSAMSQYKYGGVHCSVSIGPACP